MIDLVIKQYLEKTDIMVFEWGYKKSASFSDGNSSESIDPTSHLSIIIKYAKVVILSVV